MRLMNYCIHHYRLFRFQSVSALEAHVKRGASRLRYATPAIRDDIKLDFAHAMALTRCRLDGKRRSALLGGEGKRALAERALKPTGGTLIVVPDALLEHWRAQIGRHVDLRDWRRRSVTVETETVVVLFMAGGVRRGGTPTSSEVRGNGTRGYRQLLT